MALTEKPVHTLVKGEIVKIDDRLQEIVKTERLRRSSYVRLTFTDGTASVLPPRYRLETTGLMFR